MARLRRLLGAVTLVFVSMATGAMLALIYAWFLWPGPRGAVVPVKLEAPLSRSGEASKATIFDERQVADVYERAAPAVVAIYVRGSTQRQGLGSGVVIRPDGVVVTNHHVVRGSREIEVALSDRVYYAGEVLGADPQNDLALLRLIDAPSNLPVIPLGDAAAVRPGMLAIAIGNPDRLERSVTVGVVSGLNRTLRPGERPLRNVIQTDAAINPGNSGGPLLNSRGELIGINTAIEALSGQRGFAGIGYAVSVDTVKRFLESMLAGETIQHAWLGITGQEVTPALARSRGLATSSGVLIGETIDGGPAQRAGIQAGDVIVAVAGKPVRTVDELGERLDHDTRPGQTVILGIDRAGVRLDVEVTVEAWPDTLPRNR
jgi:S1-C subfamily serine protease